jgi:hypothetical protein
MGKIARFSSVERRLFHRLEADSISEALRSTIKHTTVMTLNSDTPIVENMPMTDDVVLKALPAVMALVVLKVLLTVLIIDDSNSDYSIGTLIMHTDIMPMKLFSSLNFIELPSDLSLNLISFMFPGGNLFRELIDIVNPAIQALL